MQPIYRIEPTNGRRNSYARSSLTIDLSLSHFAFIVVDRELNIVDHLEFYTLIATSADEAAEQISALMSANLLLRETFSTVDVFYQTSDTLLVPDLFHNPEHTHRLLHWQAGDAGNSFPMEDKLEVAGLYLVYGVPERIHRLMAAQFPSASFQHVQSAIIRDQWRKGTPGGKAMMVSVYPTSWIISLWIDHQLHLLKTVGFESNDDICYQLLNICRQWEVLPSEVKMKLEGLIDIESESTFALKRFFKEVETEVRPDELLFDDGFFGYPEHYFSTLLKQVLCGS